VTNLIFYSSKAKTKKTVAGKPGLKTKMRVIWGKITKTHGALGGVKGVFKRNLPSAAMGRRVRIVS
jgi:large subunit ribosomal protein L35Ae